MQSHPSLATHQGYSKVTCSPRPAAPTAVAKDPELPSHNGGWGGKDTGPAEGSPTLLQSSGGQTRK